MESHDPRVDAYIAKSADFARPILEQLRSTVHASCPDVTETIKWGMPFFLHRGILCHMAAFKGHCAFGFWKGTRVVGDDARSAKGMGQFGRLRSRADLPPRRALAALVRKAARLNEAGVPSPTCGTAARRSPPRPPADLRAALARNPTARAVFAALPPSGRREYVDWLSEAKRAETRRRRLLQAVTLLAAGKLRDGLASADSGRGRGPRLQPSADQGCPACRRAECEDRLPRHPARKRFRDPGCVAGRLAVASDYRVHC